MPSIHIPTDYFDWSKTRRLVRILGRGAADLPIRLWAYCGSGDHPKEDGRLPGLQVTDIEGIILWWGDRGRAMAALVDELFLIQEGGDYRVLDWSLVGGHILHNRTKAVHAINQRWESTRRNTPSNTPSITRSIGRERPGFHRFPSDGPLGPQDNVKTVRKGAQNV